VLDGRESVRQSGEGYLWCFGRAREVTVVASRAGSRRERNMVPAANRLNIKKTCSVRVQEIDLGDKINKRRRPVSLRSASEKEKKREKDRFRIRKQVRGNSSCTEGPRQLILSTFIYMHNSSPGHATRTERNQEIFGR